METMTEQHCILIGLDGEDPGPTVVTPDAIAHNIEEGYYAGFDMWTRYMACVRDANGEPALVPVALRAVDTCTTDDITRTTWHAVASGQIIGTFRTSCDLRF